MFDRILVAYHGTDRGLKAFDAAVQMAHRLDMPLHMVSVEENIPRSAELIAEVEDAKQGEDARYREVAEQAKHRAALHGVVLECAVVIGKRERAIIGFLNKGRFDLLVIGESRPSLSGLLFGSPSNRLMNLAPCSVLVVK
ncbi:MAG TPA: universal stress protein [Candidatus Acidoferrales bacterium]|nr:universal stress protein [Candidatus Acidoferrales bacterium]